MFVCKYYINIVTTNIYTYILRNLSIFGKCCCRCKCNTVTVLYLVAVYPMDKSEVRKYKVVKISSYCQSPAPNTNHKKCA